MSVKLNSDVQTSIWSSISAWDIWLYKIIVQCAVVLLLGVFGIFGNIITIIILSKHGLNKTTNIFLLSLSFCDCLNSTLSFIKSMKYIISLVGPLVEYYYTIVEALAFQASDISTMLSILHVTAISIERMVAVSFPFQVSKIFTAFRVRWVLVFLYVYTFASYIPAFCFQSLSYKFSAKFNSTVLKWTYSDVMLSHGQDFRIYLAIYLVTALIVFPLTVTIISTFIIILHVQFLKSKTLSKKASTKIKDRKIVRMLLVHCFLAMLVFIPSSIIDMCGLYFDLTNTLYLYQLLTYITPALYQLNASINFVIYITMSSKFANTYRSLFKLSEKHSKLL
ncbi:FMRFamide receptor-like [Physella acuta]|uniref:FMRFamide receptor-like n=1 Tax=Physella acuta TaxID=109671 RepID=UPI0027DCB335|nr:FMRFamide receptor-like [Physella acuta]